MESTSNTGSWNGHWTYRILINVMSIKKQPPTTPKSRAVFIESSKVWPVKRHVFFEVSPLYSDISSSHFIWHSDILYLEFYLTYNYINLSLPFYLHLSAIYSDILSGRYFDILHLAFYLTYKTFYLAVFLTFYLASILVFFLPSILTSCLPFFRACVWAHGCPAVSGARDSVRDQAPEEAHGEAKKKRGEDKAEAEVRTRTGTRRRGRKTKKKTKGRRRRRWRSYIFVEI